MLCLSGFELYPRWVPLSKGNEFPYSSGAFLFWQCFIMNFPLPPMIANTTPFTIMPTKI